jgi:murein DD-endopeptidase MepM/ murein hydrolase activator NlpD
MARSDRGFEGNSGRSKAAGCFSRALLILAFVVIVAGAVATFYTGAEPKLAVKPDLPGIGRRTPVHIRIDDPGRVETVRVEVVQGMDVKPVQEKEFQPGSAWSFGGKPPVEMTVDVGRETVEGLRAGDAILRVSVDRAGTWLRHPDPVVVEMTMPVRLAPPSLSILSTFHYVRQGGSEVVVYRVGEGAVRDGVQSGDWFFPGFPMPSAMPGSDPRQRFALFGIPYDLTDPSKIRLVAEDQVGNRAEASFVDRFDPRPIHKDTIQIDDAYLNKVVPEILSRSPEIEDRGNLLQNYLAINRELRKKNAETLKDLAAKSEPKFLWTEPFVPMINAAITASFADRRAYVYQGREIDRQDHLGFDMASVARDAIRASNRGKVVLARFFGIYGNAVVIDHGYGLMSLYGHLSSIEVQAGQAVERGQEIGRSGQTGLAGGDHLHFTLLIHGLPVNPVEWWDPHWIQDRIARKLGAVLPYKG